MTYSILYWKSYLKPFGPGGAVKLWEEKDDRLTDLINQLITKLFIEQSLALPGSAKNQKFHLKLNMDLMAKGLVSISVSQKLLNIVQNKTKTPITLRH